MVFAISEKVRKAMPKWFQNLMNNGATPTPGAPKVDFFIDFIDFGPCRKIVVFSMAFWGVQKSKKWTLGAPRARKAAPIFRQVGSKWGLLGSDGPRGGLARAVKD